MKFIRSVFGTATPIFLAATAAVLSLALLYFGFHIIIGLAFGLFTLLWIPIYWLLAMSTGDDRTSLVLVFVFGMIFIFPVCLIGLGSLAYGVCSTIWKYLSDRYTQV